jgi:Chs5-Arf1p-binding protein BUD7/BCH1
MSMAEASFKDIPELFEVELGESLTSRTESLCTPLFRAAQRDA